MAHIGVFVLGQGLLPLGQRPFPAHYNYDGSKLPVVEIDAWFLTDSMTCREMECDPATALHASRMQLSTYEAHSYATIGGYAFDQNNTVYAITNAHCVTQVQDQGPNNSKARTRMSGTVHLPDVADGSAVADLDHQTVQFNYTEINGIGVDFAAVQLNDSLQERLMSDSARWQLAQMPMLRKFDASCEDLLDQTVVRACVDLADCQRMSVCKYGATTGATRGVVLTEAAIRGVRASKGIPQSLEEMKDGGFVMRSAPDLLRPERKHQILGYRGDRNGSFQEPGDSGALLLLEQKCASLNPAVKRHSEFVAVGLMSCGFPTRGPGYLGVACPLKPALEQFDLTLCVDTGSEPQ
eukprot:TRINITY_DN1314_c0_g1_i1.p1 TRINITY_DN1314_c0_g1~~TRINITY_DN1314_c0_g1_i1.p1  ORF type:complete len:352 (+),score=57.45 TRINITY_DN1314_c0_g1_i1:515-1570(+)